MRILGLEIRKAERSGPNESYLKWLYGDDVDVNATERTALGLPAYWRAVQLISGSVAQLPVKFIKKTGENRQEVDYPAYNLLNHEAAQGVISYQYTQVLIGSAITHGNGYALIDRDQRGNPVELINVSEDLVELVKYDGELFYKIEKVRDKPIMVKPYDIIHLKGFGNDPYKGLSLLKYHKSTLGLAIGAQKYGVRLYEKGTFIDGYITMPGQLKRETKDAIRDHWSKQYGINGAYGTPVLDAGSEYKRLGMTPMESQFTEITKQQSLEICTILGVPPPLVGLLDNAHFNNVESLQIQFVTFGLGAWIKKLEQEYHAKLLREVDKKDHQVKHTIAALLRTDVKSQGEYFRQLHEVGAYSPNDIRRDLDKNPIEDGDLYTVQLNRIPIDKAREYYDRQQNNPSSGDTGGK